jgi:16S rRNA (cytidine1402-2'-O)-methyltransferase
MRRSLPPAGCKPSAICADHIDVFWLFHFSTIGHSVTAVTKTYHIGAASFDAPSLAPALYLVATPIGNLGDVSIRALQALAGCDAIYCEDTRVTGKILERYGIRNAMKNYHEHNAGKARPEIVSALRDGKSIVLVSDAGTPMISDPGYRLVEACASEGLPVTAIPGASAVLTGLQLSALPTDRFTFLGFLPEKKSHRVKLLEEFKSHAMTLVVYESPHRILDALDDIAGVMPGRVVAATRELTKLHEEVLRGTAQEVHAVLAARTSIRGEFVLVIGPAAVDVPSTDENMIVAAIDAALLVMPASKAAAHVAKALNLARDDVYARILARKHVENA